MGSIGLRLQSSICSRLKVDIQGPRIHLQTRYSKVSVYNYVCLIDCMSVSRFQIFDDQLSISVGVSEGIVRLI